MNRFEEYLNSLDRKNIIMLYISVFVIGFIVYYNYNYSVLQERIEQNSEKITKLQLKNKKTSTLYKELKKLKQEVKKLESLNASLQEDYKYLSMLVKTSRVLNISDGDFFDILRSILHSATVNNIKASYKIETKLGDYKEYMIMLSGDFTNENFKNFYDFIKSIESIPYIKKIEQLEFSKTKDAVMFNMSVSFWSIR